MEAIMLRSALALSLLATPALADPEGYGHMMDWGYGNGPGMFIGPLMSLLTLVLLIAAAVWLLRHLDGGQTGRKGSSAQDELDMRLARGEIDAEDYAARKKLLSP
jgi:putative membrane protein